MEGSREIEEMGLDGKFLSVEIVGIGKRWYTERLEKRWKWRWRPIGRGNKARCRGLEKS